MRSLLFVAASAALLAASTTPTSVASAQDTEPVCREVRPGYLECSDWEIVGRRPQGFVLLARSRVEWQPPPLVRRRATDDVVRSVRREPF